MEHGDKVALALAYLNEAYGNGTWVARDTPNGHDITMVTDTEGVTVSVRIAFPARMADNIRPKGLNNPLPYKLNMEGGYFK